VGGGAWGGTAGVGCPSRRPCPRSPPSFSPPPPAPQGLSVGVCLRWLVVHAGARQPRLGGPHTPLRRGGRLEPQLLGLPMRFTRLTSQRPRGLWNWGALIQQCVVPAQRAVMRTEGHLSVRPPSSVSMPQNRWGRGFIPRGPRTTFRASRTTGLILTLPALFLFASTDQWAGPAAYVVHATRR